MVWHRSFCLGHGSHVDSDVSSEEGHPTCLEERVLPVLRLGLVLADDQVDCCQLGQIVVDRASQSVEGRVVVEIVTGEEVSYLKRSVRLRREMKVASSSENYS